VACRKTSDFQHQLNYRALAKQMLESGSQLRFELGEAEEGEESEEEAEEGS
jgi:hypothetical protein